MSVTTTPRTESPRNSSRSFVTVEAVLERVGPMRQRGFAQGGVGELDTEGVVEGVGARPARGRRPRALLDLDRLPACVVPAVAAHPVRELGLLALGAFGDGGASPSSWRRACRRGTCSASSSVRPSVSFLPVLRSRDAVSSGPSGGGVFELGPAGIDLGVVAGALAEVAVAAADAAQALAVGAVQRRERQLHADRVADHLLGVEPALPGRVGTRRRRRSGDGDEDLVHVHREGLFEILQASGTLQRQRPVAGAR